MSLVPRRKFELTNALLTSWMETDKWVNNNKRAETYAQYTQVGVEFLDRNRVGIPSIFA